MSLENLQIKRVCLHEIHKRTDAGNIADPTLSNDLLNLSSKAQDVFRDRVIAALGQQSQCMEMAIRQVDNASTLFHGIELMKQLNTGFASYSQVFATKLANAQTRRDTPGGLIVIFDGTVGVANTPFFAVMKAELQNGFVKTSTLQAKFKDQLFLSQKSKLYKVGIFINNNTVLNPTLPYGWQATVYDETINSYDRKGAHYFYNVFLGLDFPDNAAQQVKAFYNHTTEFIKKSDLISKEDKLQLRNGLYNYLKVDLTSTIQTSQFAATYLKPDLRPLYLKYMASKKIPTTLIQKDTSEINKKLRIRKINFSDKVTLSGPPSAMIKNVAFDFIKDDNNVVIETKITIKGDIESQE